MEKPHVAVACQVMKSPLQDPKRVLTRQNVMGVMIEADRLLFSFMRNDLLGRQPKMGGSFPSDLFIFSFGRER